MSKQKKDGLQMKNIIIDVIPRINGCYGCRLVLKHSESANPEYRAHRELVRQFIAPFDVWGGRGCTNASGDFVVELIHSAESLIDNEAFKCALHNLGAELNLT